MKTNAGKVATGFGAIYKSLVLRVDDKCFSLPMKLVPALLMLALIGLGRTVISVLLDIRFHSGVWFTFDAGVVFTMLVFPIFLALFPGMVVDYACRKWRVKLDSQVILGFFIFLQGVHILIPFLEFIQRKFLIPCSIPLISSRVYPLAAISPLATTPLIFLLTYASTLGITTAWLISTAATIRFGLRNRIPLGRFWLLLMGIFYVIYVLTYPTYWLFFSQGNNFYYGMIYLLGSIGPVLYFKERGIE